MVFYVPAVATQNLGRNAHIGDAYLEYGAAVYEMQQADWEACRWKTYPEATWEYAEAAERACADLWEAAEAEDDLAWQMEIDAKKAAE